MDPLIDAQEYCYQAKKKKLQKLKQKRKKILLDVCGKEERKIFKKVMDNWILYIID